MKSLYISGLLAVLLSASSLFGQDAKAIIQKAEEVRRGIKSSQAELTMTIIRPTWTREMSMKSWSKGDDYALILVTGPARDKGNANLKRDKEVWSWVPRIERSIKLPPSMMSQSWMGSDFTNEDFVRENSIIEDYTHTLLQDSVINGKSCYKIQMIPKEEAAVIWGKIKIWVEKEHLIFMRTEYYDEDDYLINVLKASEIKLMGGRMFATKVEMVPVDEDKKGHKTVMEYQSLSFDKHLPEAFFTVQNMKRVR